jgi:hypothetical protein
MNYNKKKKRLTHAQFLINSFEKFHSKKTDVLLKSNGLDPKTFSVIHVDLARAQIAVSELERNFRIYLNPEDRKAISKFNKKMALRKNSAELRKELAYPILNLLSRMKRLAYKSQLLARKKMQQSRYNQP